MDRELARREILLLGAARWTMLWEPVVRLNELAPDESADDLAGLVVDTLRSLADRRSIKFVHAQLPGPSGASGRHRLGRAQIAAALTPSAVATPGDVWFSTTRNGERELANILGVTLAGKRGKVFGRVVAGFAAAVQNMVRRHHPRSDSDGDPTEWFGPWRDHDDDAGLAGSRVPRRPSDRSDSGAAVATPEPDYAFEQVQPPSL